MGGLFGYVGAGKKDLLKNTLRVLFHRGGDTWGIAYLDGKRLEIRHYDKNHKPTSSDLRMFILQTSWEKKKREAFPKSNGNYALAFYGVLYNEADLMELPEKNTIRAIREIIPQLQGRWAFLLLQPKEKRIYFAKNRIPLYIGVGRRAFYISSDLATVLQHTNEVVIPSDLSYGYFSSPPGLTLFGGYKKKIFKQTEQRAPKYYYEKEMMEQPNVLLETLKVRIKKAIPFLDDPDVVGSGSSYHNAQFLARLFNGRGLYPCEYKPRSNNLVVFSQSGETVDSLKAVSKALEEDVNVLLITNNPYSTLAQKAHYTIGLNVGPEVSVLSTKGFTAANLLSLRLYAETTEKSLKPELNKVPDVIEDLLTTRYKPIWRKIVDYDVVFTSAADYLPIMGEFAYRTMVLGQKPAAVLPAAEIKHSAIALNPKTTLFVALNPSSQEYEHVEDILNDLEKKIIISDINGDIPLPNAHPLIQVIYGGVVMEVLAYKLARYLKTDPDNPERMARGIMVE